MFRFALIAALVALAPSVSFADCKPGRLADGRTVLVASWPEATPTAPAAAKVCFYDLNKPAGVLVGCATARTPVVGAQVSVEGKSVPIGTGCGAWPDGLQNVAAVVVKLETGSIRRIRVYAENADGLKSECQTGAPCDREFTLDLRQPLPSLLLDLIIQVEDAQTEALEKTQELRNAIENPEAIPAAPEPAHTQSRSRRRK